MAEMWLPLLKGLRANPRELAAGEALFQREDPVVALFHLESGRLRLSRDGVSIHAAEAGALIEESSLFAPSHRCDAVAAEPCRLAVYNKTAVLLHLKAHPDLALAFAALLARGLDTTRARLQLARIRSARERVLAFLTQAGAAGGMVILDRPLTMVAAEIGLTHEALYRTLAKLEQDGAIRRDGPRRFALLSAP